MCICRHEYYSCVSVDMNISIHTYSCLQIHTHIQIFACIINTICVEIHTHTHTYPCVQIHTHIQMFVCITHTHSRLERALHLLSIPSKEPYNESFPAKEPYNQSFPSQEICSRYSQTSPLQTNITTKIQNKKKNRRKMASCFTVKSRMHSLK